MHKQTSEQENYVALMGTKGGPAIRPGSTMPTSSLLCLGGHKIVVDCGLGVSRGLIDQGVPLQSLSLIFITHMHSDHYLELGPLLHTAWITGLKGKITVIGPVGIQHYWDAFLASMRADIDLRIADEGRPDLKEMVEIKVLDAGSFTLETGPLEAGIKVSAMRNIHPPLIDTFALSFTTETHKVTFSGDTAYYEPLAEFAKDSDLLVHEAMLKDALGPLMARIGNADDRLMKHWLRSHTFADDAARLATKANVKALALHHLIPSDDPDFTVVDWERAVKPNWAGTFYLGSDGMRIILD